MVKYDFDLNQLIYKGEFYSMDEIGQKFGQKFYSGDWNPNTDHIKVGLLRRPQKVGVPLGPERWYQVYVGGKFRCTVTERCLEDVLMNVV